MAKHITPLFLILASMFASMLASMLLMPTTAHAGNTCTTLSRNSANTSATCGGRWIATSKANGLVYFLAQNPATIKRFDLAAGTWLPSISLPFTPTMFTVDDVGIYIGSPQKVIRFNLDGSDLKELYQAHNAVSLATFQNYLYLLGGNVPSSSQALVITLNKLTGALVKSNVLFYPMQGGSVLASQSLLFARTIRIDPADILKANLAADGTVSGEMDSPYHGDYPDANQTFLFPDGSRVVDESGTVYATADLTYKGSLNGAFKAIAFGAQDIYVLRSNSIIKYAASSLNVTGQKGIEQQALELGIHGNKLYYFFPAGSDIGFGTMLVDEVEPLANVPAIEGSVFTYKPDAIAIDGNNVVYLLSKSAKTIFRWSLDTKSYLSPISLSEEPAFIAVPTPPDRIYVAYASGRVVYRSLSNPTTDQIFVNLPKPPDALVTANDILLVSYPYAVHQTYSSTGQLLSTNTFADRSNEYVWNANARALFFTRDNISPNDVVRESIDVQGNIGCCLDSPYHGDHEIHGPTRVKPDASAVILGTGRIYSGTDLLQIGMLQNPISDAVWISNTLYTMRLSGAKSEIQVWDATYTQTQAIEVDGVPLRLFFVPQGLLVITLSQGAPRFTLLGENLQTRFASSSAKRTFLPTLVLQTPGLLKPGTYTQTKQCDVIYIPSRSSFYAQINMCVQSVEVREDGNMKFNLSWTLIYKASEVTFVTKNSDANNPNMNVFDNLSRRYDHWQTTGAAAQQTTFFGINQTVTGSFTFPPAKLGATGFAFNDDDQDAHICGIQLPAR